MIGAGGGALLPVNDAFSMQRQPRKWDMWWCCLLMLSLCYELPVLTLTSYDRFNPRLFDIVVICAFFAVKWKRDPNNRIVQAWELVTLVFVIVAFISYLFLLPTPYGYYSLFFAARYIECLMALWILTGFQWSEPQLYHVLRYFCRGMVFAGIWGFLQFMEVLPVARFLPDGRPIPYRPGIILSTFGVTYFHAGVMGAIGTGLSLALYMLRGITLPLFLATLASSMFLAIFSGSRAGLAMAVLIVVIMLARKIKYMILAGILGLFFVFSPIMDFVGEESVTIQRMESSGSNSVQARLGADYFDRIWDSLNFHGPKMLFVGGGFYAVPEPNLNGGGVKYRVGYGIHNIYLFVIEQAGIFGFIAVMYFWYVTIRKGYRKIDNPLARFGLALAVAIVLVGWTGQIFFFGFGTEHMVVAQVALMALTITYSSTHRFPVWQGVGR